MSTVETVVVFAPLERKSSFDKKVYCTRIRALGLTAYGDSWGASLKALKRMFATYAELHRKAGTLEARLKKSKLKWCYESQYDGSQPVEVLLADGSVRVIKGTEPPVVECWSELEEAVVAH
jgi:hypothetical protein